MTIPTPAFIRQLHDSDASNVLVRGMDAPLDPPDYVATLDAGFIATYRGDFPYLSLYVTTPTRNGRARKRFDTRTIPDAIDYVAQVLRDREFDGLWLRNHVNLVNCLHEVRVEGLETRLADVTKGTGTTLVTWMNTATAANDAVYDDVVES